MCVKTQVSDNKRPDLQVSVDVGVMHSETASSYRLTGSGISEYRAQSCYADRKL